MTIEIKVPDLPESVADATIATWHKKPGDAVERDEVIVDIETDKVVLEVPALESGVLDSIIFDEGATVNAQQVIGVLRTDVVVGEETKKNDSAKEDNKAAVDSADQHKNSEDAVGPAIRRLLAENGLKPEQVKGSGKNSRITKEDIEAHIKVAAKSTNKTPDSVSSDPVVNQGRSEKRVPMTRLRRRVAERLLEAKNTTAMLTTFNEVNMKPIMDLRKIYRDRFEERHGIRLGFMSFYVKAVVEALKRFPDVNASLDGDDIVYHNYFDVSIAVSTPRGLVTPVLHDCDSLGLADIEKKIKELAIKGRDGKLTVEEMIGGNFTITNGGVFGSLMSTPIINPPQSAILGMHKIQDRPMAIDGKVEILPMMYLALSYDHRQVDGRESVSFLVTIKELLEDPARLLLDV
ncbi:2-oxoglutarate dehydrogenase complex dihydrolipoyllysine-residue succinyltransferase [Celerinatantimonas yamalensis]|uniref:Dihydrolipoyllysine-residue succinyltransferase component of 2-oxoglutarate dehydrogenase complex n=1 Tax=Celerinatantimonas yamalensis TaxID=559956 RepID=A0ABW9G3T1_9GAMM